jgi:hypothetical protein
MILIALVYKTSRVPLLACPAVLLFAFTLRLEPETQRVFSTEWVDESTDRRAGIRTSGSSTIANRSFVLPSHCVTPAA